MPFNERTVSDERLVRLNQIVERVGDRFEYLYDFGDDWHHEILLDATLLPSPAVFYPRYVADAGPRTRGPFDSEAFSIDLINAG